MITQADVEGLGFHWSTIFEDGAQWPDYVTARIAEAEAVTAISLGQQRFDSLAADVTGNEYYVLKNGLLAYIAQDLLQRSINVINRGTDAKEGLYTLIERRENQIKGYRKDFDSAMRILGGDSIFDFSIVPGSVIATSHFGDSNG